MKNGIFLDDERKVEDVTWLKLPKPKEEMDYLIFRNAKDFLKHIFLIKLGLVELPDLITFDHDIDSYIQDIAVDELELKVQQNKEHLDLLNTLITEPKLKTLSNNMVDILFDKEFLTIIENYGVKKYENEVSRVCELTGYSCLKYLVNDVLLTLEKTHKDNIKSMEVYFHTQNPVGEKNMLAFWNNFINYLNNN